MTTAKDVQLNLRLSTELKKAIEEAAAHQGQSVTDFAIAALARNARDIIESRNATRLSNRDRDIFIAMLDDIDAKPNAAIASAAQKLR